MPFSLIDPRTAVLMRLLAELPDGVSAKEIAVQMAPPVPHRTLQRWLSGLVQSGLVKCRGRAHATRYVAPSVRGGGAPAGVARRANPGTDKAPAREAPPTRRETPPAAANRRPAPANAAPPPTKTPSPPPNPAEPPPVSLSVALLPVTKTITGARVQELLNRAVPRAVGSSVTPGRLKETLQTMARFELRSGETFEDLMTLATAELDRLIPADTARYGLDAAEFKSWRDIYWPLGEVSAPPRPGPPLPPLPATASIAPEGVERLLGYTQSIVALNVGPAGLRQFIATNARVALRGKETAEDWLTLLAAELPRMRLEDAVKRGLQPERYRAWRLKTWPAGTTVPAA